MTTLSSSAIREMQIRMTLESPPYPISIAIIKNMKSTNIGEDVNKKENFYIVVGNLN